MRAEGVPRGGHRHRAHPAHAGSASSRRPPRPARASSHAPRSERLQPAVRHNGWQISPRYIGDYGRNWLGRAVIAKFALGANTAPETVYPAARTDSRGRHSAARTATGSASRRATCRRRTRSGR